MFKKKNEQSSFDFMLMLMPLLTMFSGFGRPTTVINIYSDKKVEVKDV